MYSEGWGTTTSGGVSATKLQEVEVPVVSNSVCKTAMQTDVGNIRDETENVIIYLLFQITEAMLCAGGEKNKDGCQVSMHAYMAYNVVEYDMHFFIFIALLCFFCET